MDLIHFFNGLNLILIKFMLRNSISKCFLHLSLIFILALSSCYAQQDSITIKKIFIDDADLRMVILGKKRMKKETGIPEQGKLMAFAAPLIGSNPTLGFFYGLGGTGAIYLGSPETTNVSNVNASVMYTTNKQLITSIKGTIMTPNNGWEMLVDVRYSDYTENTYGLGSDYSQPINDSWTIGGIETTGNTGAQPLEFKQVKLYYTALKEISKKLYVGLGYNLDWHYDIEDLSLNLEAENPIYTSHYAYSTKYGFDPTESLSSALSANILLDSRDHTVNAYSGAYLLASYRLNPMFLGNQKDYQQIYLEARYFKPLSILRARHIIGLWGIGQFNFDGHAPYMHLPSSSNDTRNRIGRGYVAGRFRGDSWVTGEAEWRFPLTKNGLLGGVVFGSATTVSRDEITIGEETIDKLHLFEAVRPAGGFGLRVLLNRTGRLNLGLDMAWGDNGAKGFYFVVGETF
jgi:outer membrane protein assembly factor BamA